MSDFLRLAVLNYDGGWHPSNTEKARELLASQPELARTDVYTAAAAGDAAAVRSFLERDSDAVHRAGGPFGWAPLLYACYSRIGSTIDAVRALLDAGADPNAHFLWEGQQPPFTALTGVFGEGEDGNNQPPHPERDAIARLLLDAGAKPNDEQLLYNRHFKRDDGHLELLFAYGLNDPALLTEELWAATRKNFFDRVKLLVEHGADVNAPGRRDGRTPWESAIHSGNREIAEYLAAHGAKTRELSPEERCVLACLTGDRDEARALLGHLGREHRIALVHHAVEANRVEAIPLLAELGFEMNGMLPHAGLDRTPLHNAAWSGNVAMIKALLDAGADPNLRDPVYGGTARAWAEHNHQHEAEALLM